MSGLTTLDVAMFAFFAGLCAIIQIPRQLNTMIRWRDISVEEFEYLANNAGNPQLVVMGTSTGANLGMDYARRIFYLGGWARY